MAAHVQAPKFEQHFWVSQWSAIQLFATQLQELRKYMNETGRLSERLRHKLLVGIIK